MEHFKSRKRASKMLSGILSFLMLTSVVTKAENVQTGAVVINEVAWAGTAASASDEWIELYNTTNGAIDLSGWLIDDDNGDQKYTIPSGTIAAHSYFLIEDSQETTSVNADLIVNLSLANTGDSLVLKDPLGVVIDAVNSSGGAWYAGDATAKITMEKIDALNLNDSAANWAANTKGNGSIDMLGNEIKGTPHGVNSASPVISNATVALLPNTTIPKRGDEIQIAVQSSNIQNLFSYGFDIIYDSNVLEYVNASKGAFLSEQDTVQTSFYSGLEDGKPGKLVAGEARLDANKVGVSGEGTLFSITFRVIGADGSNADISVGAGSFLASPSNDLIAEFSGSSIAVQITVTKPVQSLSAQEGAERYKILLSWLAPEDSADSYNVYRKNNGGNYVVIGFTDLLNFIDADNLVPNVSYEYKVVAVKNGIESEPVTVFQKETRGIKGDNNRSDRVDGRDLERLALHFTETSADAFFDKLADTTYDGRIDGDDLLDIGANWALTYTPQ